MRPICLVGPAATVLAGCLSTPPAVPHDAGPDAAIDAFACDRDPRPGAACNQTDDFTDLAFPNGAFELRHALIDDINADGQQDLVLASNAPSEEGIFVLLGPVSAGSPRYHAFIGTPGVEIGDLEIRQLLGSQCPEITMVGVTTTTPTGVVHVYDYDGTGGVMYSPTPQVKSLGFVPKVTGVPMLLSWARIREQGDDLLVSDSDQMELIDVGGDFARLAEAQTFPVFHHLVNTVPMWDSVNGIDSFPVGPTCPLDQTLVAEAFHAHLLIGQDPIGGDGEILHDTETKTLGTERVDLDGNPPLDIMVAGALRFGAFLLDGRTDDLQMRFVSGPTGYDTQPADYVIDGFAVGELAGTAALRPEWIAIDLPDNGQPGESRAILVSSVNASGDTMTGELPQSLVLTGITPRAVVIGDLDPEVPGGGVVGNEAWVIGTDGTLRCLRKHPTLPQLQSCQ